MYVHGSEAFKITSFETVKKEYEKDEQKRAEKRAAARKRIALRKKRAKAVAAAFCVFALSSLMLMRGGQIAALCQDVSRQKDELSRVSALVVEKEMELERSIDLRYVEKEAQTRLGMVRPQKSQTVYVSMGSPDTAEVLAKKGDEGAFMGFINKIGAFLEYLY